MVDRYLSHTRAISDLIISQNLAHDWKNCVNATKNVIIYIYD